MSTYAELMQQINDLKVQAEQLRIRERDQFIAEVRERIHAYEITPADLFGKPKGVKVVGTVAVKYRDTNGNVWSGRGRQPFWLVKALAVGKKREDFLVS